VPSPLRIASVNANGVRAAYRRGMGDWLAGSGVDVLALQEVRAGRDDLVSLIGEGWHVFDEESAQKGRAGVAIVARQEPVATRFGLPGAGIDGVDSTGRWLEADFAVGGRTVTVVSCYVHSGEVDTPRQQAKYVFLTAMGARMAQLAAERELALVVGDLNVGHRELDIKNWRGNVKRAGFLPQERSYFDRFFGPAGEVVTGVDGVQGPGLGWIDVGRHFAGEVDGPYTWWSARGQAFDNDTGWRIDYHVATPALAELVVDYRVDRAASYAARWSDHAPVIADYAIG